ncbi:crossover junction endonuclease EME1 [Oryza glaberrima]|uniref:ERCC4 domain-containing protein n=1 Tax=Oryza glaberrima TaxID=4538 RepID=I1PQA5_ORYGL|nr:crossover junction endonuclease EME1 [Oryza glaberrima]
MASHAAVVEIIDDDDDVAAASTPPALHKRSHAVAAAAPDSPDAFSPSPPDPKRRQLAASTIVLDDTPTPPKRRPPPVAADRSASVVADTPRSFVPCSLRNRAIAGDTPDSVLPSPSFHLDAPDSATPGSDVPCSVGLDDIVPETPGFNSPRLARPPAVPGLTSPMTARKFSGVSCPISLDSDDELDDTVYRESLTRTPSNMAKPEHAIQPCTTSCTDKVENAKSTDKKDYSKSNVGYQTNNSACKNNGTTSYNQPPRANSPCEDSTLKEADPSINNHCPQEENALPIEERKKKQQEEKRLKKEKKAREIEEKKQKRLETKKQKEAMKAELAELKKLEKEKKKWESGKLATKCIVAEIDSSVIESGSVGGHLVQGFHEKGLCFRVTSNSIKGSILWKMQIPNEFTQDQASTSQVPYILFVLQAEEFCDLVSGGTLLDHVQKVRRQYPEFTICYVTNKLMSFIKRREQNQYNKATSNSNSWKRPPVEEALCKLATHYARVRSRHCTDEAEVTEHIVGLTYSLANCKFRKPLTWLSVHANGSNISKGCVDKDRIKKSAWLKSLVAIPGVSPGQAIAIEKKYPSMRSLLNVYMDDSKSVHEKEHLLEDLRLEGPLGDFKRRLGPACSKKVYTILMAQNGAAEVEVDRRGA